MRAVALVVGRRPGEFGQQLRSLRGHLAQGPDGTDLTRQLLLSDLTVDVLQVVLAVDVGLGQARVQLQGRVSHLERNVQVYRLLTRGQFY